MTPEEKKLIKARKLVAAVNRLAKKQGLNFFIVTDGASGISNNGNPAVRNAREAQIKWELEHGADPYEDWSKKAPKSISFPENEIESLKNRDSIITHRISADRGKYNKGDEVVVPWGDRYVVSDRSDLASVEDSPYKEYLTPEQKKELMKKKIALLTLSKKAQAYDRKKWPDYDKYQKKHKDEIVAEVEKLIREHFAKMRPWAIKTKDGKFIQKKDLTEDDIKDAIVRTGKAALRARRGVCHDLANARYKMLKDKGIDVSRLFVDWEDAHANDGLLGHSMVFFRGADGKYHYGNPHMAEKSRNAFGEFDDLTDAVRQYIATIKSDGGLNDEEPFTVYDTSDVNYPEIVPYTEYADLSRKGKRIMEQGHEKKASYKKKETYSSGSGTVESFTPDKTDGHDEIVLRLKNGKRVVISNNTKLGIRVIPAEGDELGYHGYQINGTNVVHKVHGNKHQRGGWLEPEKKSIRLYTYLPKDNTVDTDGILATALTDDGWKKYQGRTKMKNKDAVLRILDAIEPDWKRSMSISALEQPIPEDAAEDLVQFAKGNRLYSFDLNDLIKAGLVKHIREVNKKHTQEVSGITKHDIDWKRKPGKLLFTGIPHYMIETEDGKIPSRFVRLEQHED